MFAALNQMSAFPAPALLADAVAKLAHYRLDGLSLATFGGVWAGHLLHVFAAGLVLAGSAGWGARASSWLSRRNGFRPVEAVGIGLGLSGLAALGSGLCGLNLPLLPLLFLPAGVILCLKRRSSWKAAILVLRSVLRPADLSGRWIGASLIGMGLVCLVVSLGPENGWDPAYYHLRLPRLYALHHKITFIAYIYPSHYPQTVEMLYGLGWLLGGEGAAKLVNWSLWALAGGAVHALARPLGGRIALRSTALALTLPLAGTLASENYIDLGLTAFELLALAAALGGRFATAGILLGFAMGTKYTGILAAVALALAVRRSGWPLRRLAGLAAISALPVLPWLAKNAVFTGDPVAPFFYPQLGRLEWANGISQSAQSLVIPNLLPKTWAERGAALLLGPWWFLKAGAFAVFTPFVIGSLPLLAWGWPGRAQAIRIYALTGTALCLLLAPDGRYWQPFAFALCVLGAAAWDSAESHPAPTGKAALGIRAMTASVAWLSIVIGPLYHLVDMQRMFTPFGTVLGIESREHFTSRLAQPSPWYSVAVRWTNRNIPKGERVAVISDVQAYHFDHDAIFDCDAPRSRRWIRNLLERTDTDDDLDRQFRQWNCRTVFYIRGKAQAYAKNANEAWDRKEATRIAGWWNRRAKRIFHRGQMSIYDLGAKRTKPEVQLDLPVAQELASNRLVAEDSIEGRTGAWQEALAAGAESGMLAAAYAEAQLDGGAVHEALAAAKRAAVIAPDVPAIRAGLVFALIAARNLPRAEAGFKAFKAAFPTSEDLPELDRRLAELRQRR